MPAGGEVKSVRPPREKNPVCVIEYLCNVVSRAVTKNCIKYQSNNEWKTFINRKIVLYVQEDRIYVKEQF